MSTLSMLSTIILVSLLVSSGVDAQGFSFNDFLNLFKKSPSDTADKQVQPQEDSLTSNLGTIIQSLESVIKSETPEKDAKSLVNKIFNADFISKVVNGVSDGPVVDKAEIDTQIQAAQERYDKIAVAMEDQSKILELVEGDLQNGIESASNSSAEFRAFRKEFSQFDDLFAEAKKASQDEDFQNRLKKLFETDYSADETQTRQYSEDGTPKEPKKETVANKVNRFFDNFFGIFTSKDESQTTDTGSKIKNFFEKVGKLGSTFTNNTK